MERVDQAVLHAIANEVLTENVIEAIVARVLERLALITRRTTHGRQLLRQLLAGPIYFTPSPDGRAYRLRGKPRSAGWRTGCSN